MGCLGSGEDTYNETFVLEQKNLKERCMNRNTNQKVDDLDPVPSKDISWTQIEDCLEKNWFVGPPEGNPMYKADCQKNTTFWRDYLLTSQETALARQCHYDLEILFKIYPRGLNDPHLKMPKSCSQFVQEEFPSSKVNPILTYTYKETV